jgi:type VI secretion system secreted protein VgrG
MSTPNASSSKDNSPKHELNGAFKDKGHFYKLRAIEEIGKPFDIRLDFVSEIPDITIEDMLGQVGGVSLKKPVHANSTIKSHFHGVIHNFVYVGSKAKKHRYRAELRPHLWLLRHTRDCHVFQNLSVPKIIEEVLKKKYGFSDIESLLKKQYDPVEFCIQYRESDYQLLHRLMEREGIYYYFKFEANKHILVLCDGSSCHSAIEGKSEIPFLQKSSMLSKSEHIYDWERVVDMQPGKVELSNYDYNKPDTDLRVKLNSSRTHPHSNLEVYDYPGNHTVIADGNSHVRLRHEAYDAAFSHFEGLGSCTRLDVGRKFKLTEHKTKAFNEEYLITRCETNVVAAELASFRKKSDNSFEASIHAINAKSNFRMPRVTPWPDMGGPHTAVVVGKKGEEIWTEKLGRIKVQFHWDRVGKKDENSSCWVRVMQPWAGNAWGAMHIPRIGQEVIIQFIHGDPDQPLVVGSVYNGGQATPFSLPDQAYSSGVRSRSTKKGSTETFNELRFDDDKDKEKIYFHAEKDFVRVVENNDTLDVGFVKKDGGNQTIKVFGNQTVEVGVDDGKSGGCQTVTIFKDQTETLTTGNRKVEIKKGSDTLTILEGDRKTLLSQGSDALDITQGNLNIKLSAGACTIDAAQSILLKVGASKIEITPDSINIESVNINIKGNGPVSVKGAQGTYDGGAMLVLKAGMVKIN